jgi:Kef-type K+ transport system membrane component KefB
MLEWLQQLTPPASVTGPVLVAYVLLDVFLIVALARILGSLIARIGQPRVVGEILAGILLGPTLLGKNLSLVIAPAEARPVLGIIATVGLILFMFLAGVEYDASKVKGRGGQAGLLALLAVAVPALLGFPVAAAMHSAAYAGEAGQDLLPFALFIGAALSVTAFPVMAHILMERGELNSPMGSLGVASTGIMSVLMFTYIAFAGAVASGGFATLIQNIVLMIVFGVGSWFVVRPLLARVLPGMMQGGALNGNGMAIMFGGMILYGLIAHLIGINALVGGFVWGLILPSHAALRQSVSAKVKDVAMIFVLPVFFANAGFSADLKLLTLDTLPVVGLVLLAAIGGKFLAALPVKGFGLSWREAGVLGALFNTRGLLVLVAGLIGLQLNIITNLTFTITVVVALVTNLMTLPLLNLFSRPEAQPAPVAAQEEAV